MLSGKTDIHTQELGWVRNYVISDHTLQSKLHLSVQKIDVSLFAQILIIRFIKSVGIEDVRNKLLKLCTKF